MAKINDLYRYPRAKVTQYYLPNNNSKPHWGLLSQQYIIEAIRNVEVELEKIRKVLSNAMTTPMSAN
jgi:hypothetical protein